MKVYTVGICLLFSGFLFLISSCTPGDKDGKCRPAETRCVDENHFEICNSEGNGWDTHKCINGTCDEKTGRCSADECIPGQYICHGHNKMQCSDDGLYWLFIEDCEDSSDGFCVSGTCMNLCSMAVSSESYIGCEYWPTVLSNSMIDEVFHSDFAVVAGNPNNNLTASVKVYAHGSSAPIATASVPPGGLEIIRLPWNEMPAMQESESITRKGFIAYRLESSIPVTAYQFNPLRSKIGNTYSHTNDASLLLPSHIFGSPGRYLALSLPHATILNFDVPSLVAIVATEDNTSVTIRANGYIAAGGGLPEMSPGDERSLILSRHEVLQLASRAGGANVQRSSDDHGNYSQYNDSDMSGTLIDSDKPVAVYAGADCRFVPYNQWACDHIEQQLYPLQNWGSKYVGIPTLTPRGGIIDSGNLFRILAGVGNTQISFTPSDVHPDVVLNAGESLEFQTNKNFVVESQGSENPILMGQWLLGQNAFGECPQNESGVCAEVGDPSMILSVPVMQYRTDYHFTAVDTISDNFIGVIRNNSVPVNLNGNPLINCWTPIQGTPYQVCNYPVSGGNHHISSEEPAGVIVYGYDRYVSYGYPAGLNFQILTMPDI